MSTGIILVGMLVLVVLVQNATSVNVALGKPCRMSVSSNHTLTWSAGLAVDGQIDNNMWNNQCAHPAESRDSNVQAFWQVDLAGQYTISDVQIYNRQDCCKDRGSDTYIRVSDTPEGFRTTGQFTECAYIGSEGRNAMITKTCAPGVQGRYVTLFRAAMGYERRVMGVCEVLVNGVPIPAVQGDPHVMVNAIGLDQPICFEFIGYDGAIYELVKDFRNDIVLNAKIFTVDHLRQQRSYFDTAFIGHGQDSITCAMDVVILNGVEHSWTSLYPQSVGRLGVSVPETGTIVVDVESGIQITIIRDLNAVSDHLNVFLSKTSGLSESTTGLIGEFFFKEASIEQLSASGNEGRLLFSSTGRSAPASMSHRHVTNSTRVSCWEVPNSQVDNIMNDSISSYMIPHLEHHDI